MEADSQFFSDSETCLVESPEKESRREDVEDEVYNTPRSCYR